MSSPARIAKPPERYYGLAAGPAGRTERFLLVALPIVLLVGFVLPVYAKSDSVPDWVRAAAAQTVP